MRNEPDQTLDLFATGEEPSKPAIDYGADSPEGKVVLAELRRKPQATDHVADSIGYPLDTVRRAITALQRSGHIVDSGERCETRSFKVSVIYQATL